MSTLRNIAAHLWRGSLVRKANVVLGITGAALTAACAADNALAPQQQMARVRADLSIKDQAFDADSDGHLSREEQDAKKTAERAANAQTKAQMDSLKKDWEAYKRAIKAGLVETDFLRCEPKPEIAVTKVIGPKGGGFNIGPHKFEVPAGALDSNVTITATAPASSVAEVQFQPHGLQFNKPVQMTISYKGCVIPDSVVLGVAYVDHSLNAQSWKGPTAQRMPANDDKPATSVSALTDHFSGYVISWSRQ